jgi:hypothetical protein
MYMENGDSMGPSGLQWVIYTCVYIYIYTPSHSYGTSPRVRSTAKMICKWSMSKLFLHYHVFDRRSVKG